MPDVNHVLKSSSELIQKNVSPLADVDSKLLETRSELLELATKSSNILE